MITTIAQLLGALLRSDAFLQAYRSFVQAIWTAIFGLTVVADVLAEANLEPDTARSIAVPLTLAVVVVLGRQLPKLHPFFGYLINGVHREAAYRPPPG